MKKFRIDNYFQSHVNDVKMAIRASILIIILNFTYYNFCFYYYHNFCIISLGEHRKRLSISAQENLVITNNFITNFNQYIIIL